MKDGILKGTGNSRYLKTVEDALARYPRYEDFAAALIAGTFPFDLNGVNPAGWTQQGTALNKGTLLKDSTAENLGLTPAADATPAEVLEALRSVATRDTGNLLINSDFRDPIDDRGGYVVPPGVALYRDASFESAVGRNTSSWHKVKTLTSKYAEIWNVAETSTFFVEASAAIRGYKGTGHTINGWYLNSNTGTTICAIDDSVLKLLCSSNENVARLRRPLDEKFKAGTTLTLSALAKVDYDDVNYRCTLRLSKGAALIPPYIKYTHTNGKYRLFTTTVTLDEDVSNMCAELFWTDGLPTAEIDIIAGKIDVGNTQTLAHQDENGNWVLNDLPPNRALEALKAATSTADASDTYAGFDVSCTKLVWENASPGSAFAAQTVSLTLGPDDMVMIIPDGTGHPTFLKVGQTRSLLGGFITIDGGSIPYVPITRSCTVSTTGIQFGNGSYDGQHLYNGVSKPLYVFVVRGVS